MIRATNRSFRLFYYVAQIGLTGATGHLAPENWRRVHGNEFVPFQNELRINSVARRLIDFVAAEITEKLVFVIVIAAEFEAFAVRGKFLLFVEHDQLRCAPWLTRLAYVAPELVIGFVVTPANIIVAGLFSRDPLRHFNSRLLNSLRNRFASGEEQCAQNQIRGYEILGGASHLFNGHPLRSFAPGAIATSWQWVCQSRFSCEIDCIATNRVGNM